MISVSFGIICQGLEICICLPLIHMSNPSIKFDSTCYERSLINRLRAFRERSEKTSPWLLPHKGVVRRRQFVN